MKELESIYRQHAPAIFRFARGLCGDRSSAEDIVSETFVRILTRAPQIRTRIALAYLLAIACNIYFSDQRHRRREVTLTEEIPAPASDKVRVHRARLKLAAEQKSQGGTNETRCAP